MFTESIRPSRSLLVAFAAMAGILLGGMSAAACSTETPAPQSSCCAGPASAGCGCCGSNDEAKPSPAVPDRPALAPANLDRTTSGPCVCPGTQPARRDAAPQPSSTHDDRPTGPADTSATLATALPPPEPAPHPIRAAPRPPRAPIYLRIEHLIR